MFDGVGNSPAHSSATTISPNQIEEWRLLPDEHPASSAFRQRMERIDRKLLTGLLGPGYDSKAHPVRFALSANASPNAFIARNEVPPVIAFSTGLVDLCEKDSELAAVLIHERGHDFWRSLVGKVSNGKLEEAFGDNAAPYVLYKAGYPVSAMREVLNKLPDDAAQDLLKTATDHHPVKATRTTILEGTERLVLRGIHGVDEQPASSIHDPVIEAGFKQMLRDAQAAYRSAVDLHLENIAYASLPVDGKMKALHDLMKDATTRGAREKEVLGHIRRLKIDQTHPAQRATLDAMIDSISKPGRIGSRESYYRALQEACGVSAERRPSGGKFADMLRRAAGKSGVGLQPIGKLVDLDHAFRRFHEATTPETIKRAAAELNAQLEQLGFTNRTPEVIGDIEYAKFHLPEPEAIEAAAGRPITPSWDAQVRLAVETGDRDVLKALARVGVTSDPRLKDLMRVKTQYIGRFSSGDKIVIGDEAVESVQGASVRMHVDGEYDRATASMTEPRTVAFDAHGKIIGYKKIGFASKYAEALEHELSENAARLVEERGALKSIDWSEMERDLGKFADRHRQWLQPRRGLSDSEHPFAEEFFRRADALIARDPQKYGPALRRQFTRGLSIANPVGIPSDSLLNELGHELEHGAVGASLRHPTVRYYLEHQQAFGLEDQARRYLSFLRYFDQNSAHSGSFKERWLLDDVKLFDGLPADDLHALAKWAESHAADMEHIPNATHVVEPHFANLLQRETLRILETTSKPLSLDELHIARELASFNMRPNRTLIPILRQRIMTATEDFARSATPANALPELLKAFQVLGAERAGAGLPPSIFMEQPALRSAYQNAIMAEMQHVTDQATRAAHLETLLFRKTLASETMPSLYKTSPHFDFMFNGSLSDPAFKNWVTQEYSHTLTSLIGKDDGSKTYLKALKGRLDAIADHAPPENAQAIFDALGRKECGNQLQMQERAAALLRERLHKTMAARAESLNPHAAAGEAGLIHLGNRPGLREPTIDFLTERFDEAKAQKYIEKIESCLSEKERDKVLPNTLGAEAKLEQMRLMHRNFWNLPFEGRGIVAQQILFNPHTASEASAAREAESNLRYVLDKVLPLGEHATEETKAGRNLIESYLAATRNATDRKIITSAMLVANEPSEAGAAMLSAGKGISRVLNALKPAGHKVGQAIESHPDTPAHIKAEFKDSKTAATDLPRHEVLGLVEQSNHGLPADQVIEKTGRVLGAGSYGVTVEGQLADGKWIARTLLYDNVAAKAENEFQTLLEASRNMAGKDKRFAPVIDMVRQAHAMSGVETDMEMSARQAGVASKLYDGMKVTVDGETFTFGAAKYLGHGKGHKDFEIIAGEHFNDLVKKAVTPAEKLHIARLARAQLTAEVFNLLGGGPFDHDRHGGQQKIVGNHIGQFDFGAMTTTEMCPRQKQLIGHVFGGALKSHHVQGTPLAQAIRTEMQRCPVNEAERDFLCCVERGVLALGNFKSQVSEKELQGIIGAAFASGKVDPAIRAAMAERFAMKTAGRAFAKLEALGRESGVVIETPARSFDAHPSPSALAKPPKESWRERIPLKDQHLEIGAGAVAGLAGAGMFLDATHRIHEKQKRGEEASALDRTEQIGGAGLGAVGSGATADGIWFKSNGMKSILGRSESSTLGETAEAMARESRFGFGKVGAIALGTVALGAAAVHAYQKWQTPEPAQPKAESWATKVDAPSEAQRGV